MSACGDVNGDGIVDMDDVTLLFNHVNDPDTYPLADEWAGDVNGDGVIDTSDVGLLHSHITYPEEYPLRCQDNGILSKIIIAASGLAICAGAIYCAKSKKL